MFFVRPYVMGAGIREEAFEPHEGDQSSEARAQHLRR